MTIDDTVVETNIAAWMERLMARPGRRTMAETAPHELIIIRRHEEEEHAQHSSAWKVAHADFMTAMMAFFLIMWLINVTDDEVRKGIAQYFNPIHMSQGSSEMKGLNTVDSKPTQSAKKGHGQMPVPGGEHQPDRPHSPGTPTREQVGEPGGRRSGAQRGGGAGGEAGGRQRRRRHAEQGRRAQNPPPTPSRRSARPPPR